MEYKVRIHVLTFFVTDKSINVPGEHKKGSPFDIQGRGLTVTFRNITFSSFGGQTINSKYNQGS